MPVRLYLLMLLQSSTASEQNNLAQQKLAKAIYAITKDEPEYASQLLFEVLSYSPPENQRSRNKTQAAELLTTYPDASPIHQIAAYTYLLKQLRSDPRHNEWNHRLGTLYFNLNDFIKAEKYLSRSQNNSLSQIKLGFAIWNQKKQKEALKIFKYVYQSLPHDDLRRVLGRDICELAESSSSTNLKQFQSIFGPELIDEIVEMHGSDELRLKWLKFLIAELGIDHPRSLQLKVQLLDSKIPGSGSTKEILDIVDSLKKRVLPSQFSEEFIREFRGLNDDIQNINQQWLNTPSRIRHVFEPFYRRSITELIHQIISTIDKLSYNDSGEALAAFNRKKRTIIADLKKTYLSPKG